MFELYFAGTDTTANTLLAAILYLMNYPQIQGRSVYLLSVSTLLSCARGMAPGSQLVTTIKWNDMKRHYSSSSVEFAAD